MSLAYICLNLFTCSESIPDLKCAMQEKSSGWSWKRTQTTFLQIPRQEWVWNNRRLKRLRISYRRELLIRVLKLDSCSWSLSRCADEYNLKHKGMRRVCYSFQGLGWARLNAILARFSFPAPRHNRTCHYQLPQVLVFSEYVNGLVFTCLYLSCQFLTSFCQLNSRASTLYLYQSP